MIRVVVAAAMLVLGCGGNKASNDAGVDAPGTDALDDAAIDADEGIGTRIEVTTLGVLEPIRLELDQGGVRQRILVTEDTDAYRFPRRVPDVAGVTVQPINAPQRCVIDGPTLIAADRASVVATCDGVMDLRAIATTIALRLRPAFDRRGQSFVGYQPLLLEVGDPFAITPTLAFPGASVDMLPASPMVTAGVTNVTLTVRRSGFSDRAYTLAMSRELFQEAYGKATDQVTDGRAGGSTSIALSYGGPPAISIPAGGLAISGDTLAIGAPGANAVYVFQRAGLAWSPQAKLVGPKASSSFGMAVALDGATLVVGAPHDLPNGGAAYVYRYDGAAWALDQTLRPTLTDNALFGATLALAGSRIVIGAPNHNALEGAAFLYQHDGTAWALDQTLTNGAGIDGRLGSAVAISTMDVVVGAPGETSSRGAAYVFVAGSSWSTRVRIAPTNVNGAAFGAAVAMEEGRVVAGAPNEAGGNGVVRTFVRTTATWPASPTATNTLTGAVAGGHFGAAVAIHRGHLIVGTPDESAGLVLSTGAAYFFRCAANGTCSQERRVAASNPGDGDRFGSGVTVNGDSFVVGAPGEDSTATGIGGTQNSELTSNSGAFYVFR